MSEIIAGIDVGTTKICVLIAEVEDNEGEETLHLIGAGLAAAQGLEKGMVVNVPQASESIAQAVEEAELAAGLPIRNAYVGISGKHISTMTNRGVVPVSRSSGGITPHDVEQALDAARTTASKPPGREIIHAIPRRFSVDEQTGIRDPIGMHGDRLEVEAQIVLGVSSSIANLVKCVHGYGVEVEDLVLEPLASGEAVLTSAERELGVVVVDIGGGTTDIAIFLEDSLWHTVVGSQKMATVPRRILAHILAARAEETLELILTEIKRSGYDGMLPAGMVLCGGTSLLPGLTALSQKTLQSPVRIGSPDSVHGLARHLASPAFATAVGLLLWGQRHQWRTGEERRDGDTPWDRVSRWLRNLLPG
jgi:cell division protein FtsA